MDWSTGGGDQLRTQGKRLDAAAMAGSGWWWRGRATKSLAARVDLSFFFNEKRILESGSCWQGVEEECRKLNIQPGKLTYLGIWYYEIGQRKLPKPPTMAL
jgi:hypothetical protein